MGLISSFRKQRKLRRISRVLGSTLDISQLIDKIGSGNYPKEVNEKNKALEDLLDLCESDPVLRQIMENHGADRDSLRELYKMLIANGAGQWAGRHFVAASALAFGFPLLFLFQNAQTLDWRRICVLLVEYFERNEVGPVPLEVRGPADPDDPLNTLWTNKL